MFFTSPISSLPNGHNLTIVLNLKVDSKVFNQEKLGQ